MVGLTQQNHEQHSFDPDAFMYPPLGPPRKHIRVEFSRQGFPSFFVFFVLRGEI
jgi:hypothetical protein